MTSQTILNETRSGHPTAPISDLRSPLNGPLSGLYELVQIRRGASVAAMRGGTLLVLDLLMLTLAWWVPQIQTVSPIQFLTKLPDNISLLPLLCVTLGLMMARRLYKPGEQWQNFRAIFKAVTVGTLLGALTLYTYQPEQLKDLLTIHQFLIFWVAGIFLLSAGRLGLTLTVGMLRSKGSVRHPAFLICDENECERALQTVENEKHYVITGTAGASALDRDNRANTMKMLQEQGVDEVFVSWDAISRRLFLCWHFQKAGITLQILPASLDPLFWHPEVWMMGGIPTLKFAPMMFTGFNFWVKRYVDFIGALAILLSLSPIYLTIAALIRLDSPGPIFYKQTRVGLHGQEFKAWKFRSMVTNADKLQKELESKNEAKDGILFKMKDDPRITRVGKFLRQYSLDELPQIFNVLLGEMSLVGPRPLPLRDVEKFSQSHFIRHEVLPGITGLWQVSGRSNVINFDNVIRLDLMYIENWSLWLDFKILLKTVQVVLKKTGAY